MMTFMSLTEMGWMQVGIFCLIASLFLYVARWLLPKVNWVWHTAWASLLAAGLCFVISLWIRSLTAQYFALSNMYESLLVVSIAVLGGFLVMDRWWRVVAMGWPVVLLVLTSVGFAMTLPTDIHPLQAALQSYWRAIHVPVILTSYAMFTLSFISSLLFLVQTYTSKQPLASNRADTDIIDPTLTAGEVFSATPLNLAGMYDEVTYRCVAIGFPLLAIGVILGGLWANEAWGNYWSWDPKESMSLVTLLTYGVYLHLRVNGEHSARTLAWVSVAGFVMMLVTYFGVNLMGLGLHSYGKIG